MALSKRLRFEILRRDNHQCRYCGATTPEAKLTIDHVVPVALGGLDDPSNLVTACRDCNAGKSASPPDANHVDQVANDALRWAAAMRAAADEMRADARGRTDIYNQVDARWYRGNRPADWTDSIDKFLDAGLPEDIVLNLVDVAQNKRGEMGYRWSYFCGCCWRRVRDLQERAGEIAGTSAPSEPHSMPTTWTAAEIAVRVNEALDLYEECNGRRTTVDEMLCCEHTDYAGHCGDAACLTYQAGILAGFLRGKTWVVPRGA